MTVKELQQESLEVLKIVSTLCDNNGIRYYLAAGSLLGAVRHKGFIPWDDDIDIEVMYEDYYTLLDTLEKNSQQYGIKVQSFKQDDHFPYPFAKIFFDKVETAGLHYPAQNEFEQGYVDIFPLSGCTGNDRLCWCFWKMEEVLTVALVSKVRPEGLGACRYKKKAARMLFYLFRPLRRKDLFCMREAVTRAAARIFKNSGFICYPIGKYGLPEERYRKEWYAEREKLVFEEHEFYAPYMWNEILSYKYGEYMQLPPEEERIGHY